MELPNLLLATTYALNKSNSKRLKVGLENDGEVFSPKVKFCGSSSPSRDVTMDQASWEMFLQHKESILAYLREDFVFIRDPKDPMTIELPKHILVFTVSYGKNAVMINEKRSSPLVTIVPAEKKEEDVRTETSTRKRTLDDLLNELDVIPVNDLQKNVKSENLPCVAMHLKTIEGLLEILECVNLRMQVLSDQAKIVNTIAHNIMEYLKGHFKEQDPESVKKCLISFNTFKKYYCMIKLDIEFSVRERAESQIVYNVNLVELIFAELNAFGLFNIAKAIHNTMFEYNK